MSFETRHKIANFIEKYRGRLFIVTIILIVFCFIMKSVSSIILWDILLVPLVVFCILQFLPLEMMIDGVG